MNQTTDTTSAVSTFQNDVLTGLKGTPKSVPSKYLYDARGSQLFEDICQLDEYYPTRTELKITRTRAAQMADAIGPRVRLVELGAGSGKKTHSLLEAVHDPAAYMPVEISESALDGCARTVRQAFPDLEVIPVCADYTQRVDLPMPDRAVAATVAYFPGSTLGNFTVGAAAKFLARLTDLVGDGGGLLIGVDLQKDPDVLRRAYNDSQGVTAAFNLNLLTRLNRELDANFQLDNFRHRAVWNGRAQRIEMRLVSQCPQEVAVAGEAISFGRDESILTEYSHKYTLDSFEMLAHRSGFDVRRVWTDRRDWFSVWYLQTDA